MAKGTGRDEEKRQQRLERKAQAERAQAARVRRARLKRVLLGGAAVVAIGVAAFLLLRPDPEVSEVEKHRSQGRTHVDAGQRVSYDTSTPTSGPHWAQAPRCGIYREPLEPELAVHALEHGSVVLWYRDGMDDEGVAELEDIARRWDSHVIVSPNDRITAEVVATAWRRLKRFDAVGEPVAEFVDTYRNRGPEKVDCPF